MRRFVLRNLTIFVGVILFLVVGESFLRIYGAVSGYIGDDPRFDVIEHDPVRMMRLKKDYRGRVFNKQGEFDVEISTNAFGVVRDEEIPEKISGRKRVLLLGDSFIAGCEVTSEQRLDRQLQENFDDGVGENLIEVLPYGVPGYAASHEYLALRDEALRLDPDLVVHFSFPNDVSDNLYMERITVKDSVGLPIDLTPMQKVKSFMLWNSLFYNFIYKQFQQLRNRLAADPNAGSGAQENVIENNFTAIFKQRYVEADSLAWQVQFKYLHAMNRLLRERGTRFVVVSIPLGNLISRDEWQTGASYWFPSFSSPIDTTKMDRLLESFCMNEAIPFYPLSSPFRNYKKVHPDKKIYFDFDGHWTAEGHRVVADSLYAFMIAEKSIREVLLGDWDAMHQRGTE